LNEAKRSDYISYTAELADRRVEEKRLQKVIRAYQFFQLVLLLLSPLVLQQQPELFFRPSGEAPRLGLRALQQ
jgi:hypothetical protein